VGLKTRERLDTQFFQAFLIVLLIHDVPFGSTFADFFLFVGSDNFADFGVRPVVELQLLHHQECDFQAHVVQVHFVIQLFAVLEIIDD